MNEFLFGKTSKKTTSIAKIGIMLALTLTLQYITGLAGIQLLTGSIVNMMLLISLLVSGLIGGLVVGLISPFVGFLLGLSGNILLTPFIGISNAIFITLFAVMVKIFQEKYGKLDNLVGWIKQITALVIASTAKFIFLFFVTLKLILPLIMDKVPPILATTFGITQIFTAMIGGVLAIILSMLLEKRNLL